MNIDKTDPKRPSSGLNAHKPSERPKGPGPHAKVTLSVRKPAPSDRQPAALLKLQGLPGAVLSNRVLPYLRPSEVARVGSASRSLHALASREPRVQPRVVVCKYLDINSDCEKLTAHLKNAFAPGVSRANLNALERDIEKKLSALEGQRTALRQPLMDGQDSELRRAVEALVKEPGLLPTFHFELHMVDQYLAELKAGLQPDLSKYAVPGCTLGETERTALSRSLTSKLRDHRAESIRSKVLVYALWQMEQCGIPSIDLDRPD